ncbi:amidohydrolase family protein [Parerythrobacter lacustris]|uniref:Amidohydrolase n=1 Tax=Parerythrobacter lacustris TaxID=2969984 RepID=A0ABT1XPC0_9SPHN|nr:amidohydrolase [Parerythrobacter lacustris]MCR2833510.1 amidohydrolase [Parerythrobacter lacustris]
MTYTRGRVVNDADAHTMETQNWLAPYLEGEYKEMYSEVYSKREGGERITKMIDMAKARKSDPEARAKALENPIEGAKGWLGYGGFDKEERIEALDWLGFQSQLVFPTFGLGAITRAATDDQRYAAARALNRAQQDFCDADPRLECVAFAPLDDPQRALEEARFAIERGAAAVMFSAGPAGNKSPGHPDFDPFWQLLQDRQIPFMLHIGPGTKTQPGKFKNNGRERAPDLHGGGENLRFPDFLCLWYAPQEFLTAMIYDGVFQSFPGLRGGVIESGAGWVPEFLRMLDHGWHSFNRTDPYLQALDLMPSEYIKRAVRFTPFPNEDVGRMIRDSSPELYMFSSDYPHPEGTKDPLGKFEASLAGFDDEVQDMFFRTNYDHMMFREHAAVAVAAE